MSMNLSDLDHRGGEWLRGEGDARDTVISSRVRLARNVAGFPFVSHASEEQRQEIVDRVKEPLAHLKLAAQSFYVDVAGAEDLLGSFLVERHLISRELQNASGPRGVAFGSDEVVSVMVNEEDHLRIQAIKSALALEESYQAALAVDRGLEHVVDYAASTRLGYLTACPTNVGTGLRASVMLHLPAMVQMKQIEKLFNAASKTGLTVRGFYGEGTMASGDLYQISNQVTLGRPEEGILADLQGMLPKILEYERVCRRKLKDHHALKLEDRCHRALAQLRSARLLSSEEAMQFLSLVRLGAVADLLDDVDIRRVNELFVLTQPAHVQKIRGTLLDPAERDAARADYVRAALSTSS